MPCNQVSEHINSKACGGFSRPFLLGSTKYGWMVTQTIGRDQVNSERGIYWLSQVFLNHGKIFVFRRKRKNQTQFFDTLMLGSEKDCEEFITSITVFDRNSKMFTKNISHPRPISLEKWGHMGLTLPEQALSRIWKLHRRRFIRFWSECFNWKCLIKSLPIQCYDKLMMNLKQFTVEYYVANKDVSGHGYNFWRRLLHTYIIKGIATYTLQRAK